VIALTAGVPAPELYPRSAFLQIIVALLRSGDHELLGPCATAGHRPLREVIAKRMSQEGAPVTWDQILVTTGSQQGLDLLARAFLEPGDGVIIEAPTYLGALGTFGAAGARLLSVPLDEGGLRLDILEGLLARHRPKLIYTLPTFQNPSGVTQDLERRLGLLALAARYGVPVVEDDPYGPLYFHEPPPPTLKALDQRGSVIYLGTFSKIMFPGLRLGWIAAPRPVIERLARIKQRIDLYGNSLAQWATAAFIEAGHLEEHLAHVRSLYLRRRDAMVAALAEHCPDLRYRVPDGGFNLWCHLPRDLKSRDLLAEAGQRGVAFAPGELFYAEGGGEHALRLNFSSQPESRIREGIVRLGQALEALRARVAEAPTPERVVEPLV
jgi:DNA-binding transcriptional MocR family regulator